MGNNNHIPESSALLSEFEQVRTHPLTNHSEIRHKKTKQLLLVKQLSPAHPADSQNIRQLLREKHSAKSIFVTEVVRWEHLKFDRFCSKGETFLILFNNAGITLREYLEVLTRTRQKLSCDQICSILESLLKAIKHFHTLNHVHQEISIDSILYDGKRTVLLDPWLAEIDPALKNHRMELRQQNQIIYKSPEKELYQADQISSFDIFKSLLYEIGLLMIDLALDGRYTQLQLQLQANHQASRFRYERINIGLILQEIQSMKLTSKLNILLHLNPEKRLVIYNILLPQKLALNQLVTRKQSDHNPSHRRMPTQTSRRSENKQIKSLKKKSQTHQRQSPSPPSSFLTNNPTPQKRQANRYHSYHTSPLRRSLEKKDNIRAQTEEPESAAHHEISPTSSFTYAQLLQTQTQQAEIVSITKNKTTQPSSSLSNWPYPHKIININTNGNINVSINMNMPQKQKQGGMKPRVVAEDSRITQTSREQKANHARTQSMFSNLSMQKLSEINSVNLEERRKQQNSIFQPSTLQSNSGSNFNKTNMTNNTSLNHSRNNSLEKRWEDTGIAPRGQALSREKPHLRFQYISGDNPTNFQSLHPITMADPASRNASIYPAPTARIHPLLMHQTKENIRAGPIPKVNFIPPSQNYNFVPNSKCPANPTASQSTQTTPISSSEQYGKSLSEQYHTNSPKLGHKFTFQCEGEQQSPVQSPSTPSFNRKLFNFQSMGAQFSRKLYHDGEQCAQPKPGYFEEQAANKGENPDGMDVRMKTKTIQSLQQEDQQIYQLPQDNKKSVINSPQKKDDNKVSYIHVSTPQHPQEERLKQEGSGQDALVRKKSESSGISEGTKQVNKQEQEELRRRIQIEAKYDNLNIDNDPKKMSRRSSLSAKETESIIFQNGGKGRSKDGHHTSEKKNVQLESSKSVKNVNKMEDVVKIEDQANAFVSFQQKNYNNLAKGPMRVVDMSRANEILQGEVFEKSRLPISNQYSYDSTSNFQSEVSQKQSHVPILHIPAKMQTLKEGESSIDQMVGPVLALKQNYSERQAGYCHPRVKRGGSSNTNSITSISKDIKTESPLKNNKPSLYNQGGRLVVSIENGTETSTESIVEHGFVFGQGKNNSSSNPNSNMNSNPNSNANSNSNSKIKVISAGTEPTEKKAPEQDETLFRGANRGVNLMDKTHKSHNLIDNMQIIQEILSYQLIDHLKDLEDSQESKHTTQPLAKEAASLGPNPNFTQSLVSPSLSLGGEQPGTLINILKASSNSGPSSIALSRLNLATNSVPNSSNSIGSPLPLVIVHSSAGLQSEAHLKYYVVQTYPVSTALLSPTVVSIQLPSSRTLSSNNLRQEKYEGYKQNGMRSGHGTYYYANGCIYEGEWKEDAPHGYGKYYRPKLESSGVLPRNTSLMNLKDHYEVMCEGYWINGELIDNVNTLKTIEYATQNQLSVGSSGVDMFKTSIQNKLSIKQTPSFSREDSSDNRMRSLVDNLRTLENHSSATSFMVTSIPSIATNSIRDGASKTSIIDNLNGNEASTIKLNNGDIFQGQIVNGLNKTMVGKIFWLNGNVVEGKWALEEQPNNK